MLRPRHIGLIGLLVLLLVVVFVVKPVSSGGGSGQAIEGQNLLTPVVPTLAAINCANSSIVCANGGSGRLDLTVPTPTVVPTATPQPTPTPGAGGSVPIIPIAADASGTPVGWTAPPGNCFTSFNQGVLADTLYYNWYYTPTPYEIDQLRISVASASSSGVARIGIYASNDGDWQPDELLLDAGTVSTASTGIKTIDITDTVVDGAFLIGIVADESLTYQTSRCFSISSPMYDFFNSVPFFAVSGQGGQISGMSDPGAAWSGVASTFQQGQLVFVQVDVGDTNP